MLVPLQQARRTQLAALPVPPGGILFLGDSITEFGVWSEWFPGAPIVNRGVAGETTAQVLLRIEDALNEPTAVFLLIGTNDLTGAVPTADIVDNLRKMLHAIRTHAPGASVIVQSIMPRALAYREEVIHLNHRYRELVDAVGANVAYLDLWPVLATPEGTLRPELTEDGLHLNGAGYRAWVQLLRPIVDDILA
ncbi:GDSL-type esterase/lipase family protein [Nocardia sp. NPDC050712]|uniref:GDSL-type esterase/lipase family protein n=1 Tax=Nocardia sp. NPDC050712 TaxID=3155518 RepID=UPI0033CBDF2A